MKAPKFTDQHRFPRPYRKSNETDIKATFKAIRARQKQVEPENVVTIVTPSRQSRKSS